MDTVPREAPFNAAILDGTQGENLETTEDGELPISYLFKRPRSAGPIPPTQDI